MDSTLETRDTRIFPIVGDRLRGKRIAVLGARCAWAAELLASCGAQPWHGRSGSPDALLIDASACTPLEAASLAHNLGCPAVVLAWPRGGWAAGHVWLCAPGGAAPVPMFEAGVPRAGDLSVLELNAIAADLLRAYFTDGTAYAPAGWCERIRQGRTVLSVGSAEWPWQIAWDTPERFAARAARAHAARAHVHTHCAAAGDRAATPIEHALIVGLGSLGSWVAHALRAQVRRFTLVDGDRVEPGNLARQWYRGEHVGMHKALALAAQLPVPVSAVPRAVDERALAALLARARPSVAVVATGGDDDFAIARALRRQGIPDVVARCYPRARYFESIVVDGARGPCLGCLRGHLYTGPAPGPTPEERAAYDLAAPSQSGAAATQPATRLEVGRAALAAARLALALEARAGWLQSLLSSGRTCLLGANVCEDGAYGFSEPLQVLAYGLPDIVGTRDGDTCGDCGRLNATALRV